MVGINKGCIINCSSENIEFQHPNGNAAGVSYSNYGKILNCYTSGCNFLHTQYGAGICYTMEPQSEIKTAMPIRQQDILRRKIWLDCLHSQQVYN